MTDIPQTPDSGQDPLRPSTPLPVDPTREVSSSAPADGGCCCGSPRTLGAPPHACAPAGVGESPSTPLPDPTSIAGTPAGQDKRDLLKTSPVEQAEIEHFIAKGHGAHSTVFLLSLVGILLVFLGAMYWNHFDYYRDGSEYVRFGQSMLPALIENQNTRDWNAYQPRPGVAAKPTAPRWPEIMYRKMRFDSYLIAGLAFLLALVMIHIEKAKMRRNDLLIFRAMAREIEKLRMRLRQLERKKKEGDDAGSD